MLDGWTLFYGAITAITIWLAFKSRTPGVRPAAYLLGCSYLLSNFSVLFIHPYHGQLYPLMDTIFAAVFLTMWMKTDRFWIFAVGIVSVVMTIRHAMFFTSGDNGYLARYAYDLSLNLLYLLQLLIVSAMSVVRPRRVTA